MQGRVIEEGEKRNDGKGIVEEVNFSRVFITSLQLISVPLCGEKFIKSRGKVPLSKYKP